MFVSRSIQKMYEEKDQECNKITKKSLIDFRKMSKKNILVSQTGVSIKVYIFLEDV